MNYIVGKSNYFLFACLTYQDGRERLIGGPYQRKMKQTERKERKAYEKKEKIMKETM